jgi:hypothetical protein
VISVGDRVPAALRSTVTMASVRGKVAKSPFSAMPDFREAS